MLKIIPDGWYNPPLSRQCKKAYNYSQLHVLFGGDFSMSRTNKVYSTGFKVK